VLAERQDEHRDRRRGEREQRIDGVGTLELAIAAQEHLQDAGRDADVVQRAVGRRRIRRPHVERVPQQLVGMNVEFWKAAPGRAQGAEPRRVGEHREEGAIERGVVRDDHGAVREELDDGADVGKARLAADVLVAEVVEGRGSCRDRNARIDKLGERAYFATTADDAARDLDDRVAVRIGAGRLHVDDHGGRIA
jgi:hypothetical protein